MKNYKELFMLDPDVVFLNHGSFGATPRQVFEVYQNWQQRLERQPVLFLGREHDELLRESRKILAEYLGAAAEDLVYIPNATYGVNTIARSLHLKVGDEILTSDHEYGACDYTWNFISDKVGAKYRHHRIELPLLPENEIIDSFFADVTPRTKVIYLSHITSPSAIRFPVEAICHRARQNGILTVIDGAHSMGQLPISMEDIGADFYTSNCHKWSMAPKGSAFLYARKEVQNLVEPLVVSWGYGNPPTPESDSRYVDMLQWAGTKDPAAALSVPAAIKFMVEYNWDVVRQDCKKLLEQAISRICQLTDQESIYPPNSDYFSQMGVAPLPKGVDLVALKRRLYDEYRVEVPLTQVGETKFIRISIQGYNNQEDIDILISALEKLLPVTIS